jgi:Undecaprenyl-phosphate glucose phosphotransferase
MASTSAALGISQKFPALRTAMSQQVLAGLTVMIDAALIIGSGLALHFILDRSGPGDAPSHLASLGAYALMAVLAQHAAGTYRFTAIMVPARVAARVGAVCVAVFMLLVATAFALKIAHQFSRLWSFSALLTSTLLVIAGRFLLAYAMHGLAAAGRIGRRIVVYGANEQARRLVNRIDTLNEPWNHIAGVFDDRRSRRADAVGDYPVLGNLADLIAWARQHQSDEILIALPWSAEERLLTIMRTLAVLPANVRLCPEFFHEELIHGRTSYQYGMPMLSTFEKPIAGWGSIWKRLFDLLMASLLLIPAVPLLLLIALCIRLESPGPVLFRQRRYGFNYELIEVFKFRTMRQSEADPLGDRLTERNDPRVTRVGAILRRTSLDELPQLINVLRGQMSVIGPRPHAVRTTAGGRLCEEVVDHYAVRHKVKPGMTGWAQVNGWRGTMCDEEHLRERVAHDLYYIRNWSPWLDLQILARTAWTVLVGRNSY